MSKVITDPVKRGRTLSSSNPKRVLFYGACHATIFARIFEQFCTDFSYSFDVITNYQIIHQGIPFPYERIGEWDIVVFSPIFNYAEYETTLLKKACDKSNVRYICYPYLDWRGYFPYMKDAYFINMRLWHYPQSIALARTAPDFPSYSEEFNKLFRDDDYIFKNLESSTEHLRENEKLGGCDFIISDYILNEYRNKRLFLIPAHPTQVLYVETIKRLNEILRIPIDPAYFYSTAEPQEGVKVPIHPELSLRLGLNFQDADFQNNTSSFATRNIPWSDYLKLAYGSGRGSTMWEASSATAIKRVLQSSDSLDGDKYIRVPKGTILQAFAKPTEDFLHLEVDITWTDPLLRQKLMNWNSVYIYKEHWQETVQPDESR